MCNNVLIITDTFVGYRNDSKYKPDIKESKKMPPFNNDYEQWGHETDDEWGSYNR